MAALPPRNPMSAMVTIPHRSGPSPSRCPGLKAWKVTVRSAVKASPGTSTAGRVEAAGHIDGQHGCIDLGPGARHVGKRAAESHAKQCIDQEICRLRLAQGLDPHSGRLCGARRLLGRRVAFLGRTERVDRDGATSSGQILGSDVAVATVVAGPGEHRDTSSVAGTHVDRRKCHGEPGSLHQHFDRFRGGQVEPTGFFGGDHQLHGLSISVREHRAQSQLNARPSKRRTPAPDRRCG